MFESALHLCSSLLSAAQCTVACCTQQSAVAVNYCILTHAPMAAAIPGRGDTDQEQPRMVVAPRASHQGADAHLAPEAEPALCSLCTANRCAHSVLCLHLHRGISASLTGSALQAEEILAAADGGTCRELRLWGPRCVICMHGYLFCHSMCSCHYTHLLRSWLASLSWAQGWSLIPSNGCHACRIHPCHFPRSLEAVKLDLWRYEGADVRALAQLAHLSALTFHFLPVRPLLGIHDAELCDHTYHDAPLPTITT